MQSPPATAYELLHPAVRAAVYVLLGAAGVLTALALAVNRVKAGIRAVVLWACEEDVKQRKADHAEVMGAVGGLKQAKAESELRMTAHIERVVDKLDTVAKRVEHFTEVFVEKGMHGGRDG